MKIDILCSSPDHPIVPRLRAWAEAQAPQHEAILTHDTDRLTGGNVLFLVSCTAIIGPDLRARYDQTIVLHASDLPAGRGWSPHVWAILEGADSLTVTALQAADPVDSGAIWTKAQVEIPADALFDEINDRLFTCELELMEKTLDLIAKGARPAPQPATGISHYPRRTPADSELDPDKSLARLFDAIRIADPDRYPAFFRLRGATYTLFIQKVKDGSDHH